MDKSTSCCFTGHRPSKLPWKINERDARCLDLKNRIYSTADALYASGIRHYICGMAAGCDMYFCEAVFKLRQIHGDITVEAAIPWQGQSEKWSDETKKRYDRLVSECDYQTVVAEYYSIDCMMRRNRYMVDNSSVIIAAYNGSSGGTMKTLLYAMRESIEIIELPL